MPKPDYTYVVLAAAHHLYAAVAVRGRWRLQCCGSHLQNKLSNEIHFSQNFNARFVV